MAETRVASTSTGQYDMLLATSQDSINAALLSMWDLDGDNMQQIDFDASDVGVVGWIKATIGAPDMQVNATGPYAGSILFRLSFVDGKIKVFDKAQKKAVEKSAKGFKICFKVDIALNDLHSEIIRYDTKLKDSTLSPDDRTALETAKAAVQAKIDQFGAQAGDFSIQQLFVDFASADISSLPESELVLPGLDTNQVASFAYMLQQWLAANKGSDQTTLGYGLSVSPDKADAFKVNKVLVPTSVSLQTYPYKATPSADPLLGWNGDAARNSLVYCNMSQDRAVQGDRYLAWSGNFTTINPDKEKRVDGTAIIRRGLFLDQFVIPMLRQYNDDMQIVAETMDISRDGDAGQRRFHWHYKSNLGYNPSHPSWTEDYFQFRDNGQGATLSNIVNHDRFSDAQRDGFDAVGSTEGWSWSWSGSCDTGYKEINLDWHFPHDPVNWTDHLNGQNKSYSAVDVIPVPGQGIVKVRGYSEATVSFNGYYTRLLDDNLDYKGDVRFNAYWQVDIVITSSEDQGMQCEFKNQKVFKYSTRSEQQIPPNESLSQNFIDTLSNNIDTMLKDKDSICKAINDALDATGKFSHPATGSFNFKDPVFNRRGDIMVTAQYKAPKKDRIGGERFNTPEIGDSVKQRAPNDVGKSFVAEGDVKAPIPKKG